MCLCSGRPHQRRRALSGPAKENHRARGSRTNSTDDEKHLAQLGYAQELNRSWSGFSNFAISFSIISILAGCFTSFGLGWNNGGPAAIAWGWPIVSVFILIIGLCMSELVSAYPTSGGIYWWASKLGGAKAGFYTGWLNLIGLIAILASVAYGCATFLDLTLGTFSETWLAGYSLTRTFILFVIILAVVATINIFSSHLLAVINNVSVWWHVAGAAAVILILFLVPEQHASFGDVFAKTINNTRHVRRRDLGLRLPVLRAADLGDPDPVHDHRLRRVGAPVRGDQERGRRCGQGHLAVDLLLGDRRLDPAAVVPVRRPGRRRGVGRAAARSPVIFAQAMDSKWVAIVLLISTAGQFFCTTACQTSASRMLFAFSRDRAVPGHQLWSKVSTNKIPANGVIVTAVLAAIITLPRARRGRHQRRTGARGVLRGGVHRRGRAVPVLRGADLLPLEGSATRSRSASGTCADTTSGWRRSR